jgi:ATP-dependent protease ClpP protease subunit
MTLLATLLISFQARALNLNTANTVNLRGSINESSVAKAYQDIESLRNLRGVAKYPIYLVVNSPGGSVLQGMKLIKYMKTVPNLKVICLFCASMAHAILQHHPEERLILEDSMLMAHRASATFRGQFAQGEVESTLKVLSALINYLESITANRIGLSLKDYKQKIINEWWTFGAESIKQNVADRVITINCSRELEKKQDITIEESFFGQFKIAHSGCPLIEFEIPVKEKKK